MATPTITIATSLRCADTGFSPPSSHQFSFLPKRLRFPLAKSKRLSHDSITRAVDGRWKPNLSSSLSSWDDDEPFEILPNGKTAYLDEADVVTFLDPPKELVPLDPTSYNPAAYLWKKIGDIPEERRYRLLQLLDPRLVKRAWEIAGTRYEDAKLAKKCSSNLLSGTTNRGVGIEYWNCRASGGPLSLPWLNSFKKAIFIGKDGNTYGRIIVRSVVPGIPKMLSPLYFTVKESKEVMSTEQPCDFVYDLGDGLLDLNEYPHGFPRPAKHPHPFNDQVAIYIRNVGPGVLIGQAWQEGVALEQVPRKLCEEILMAKEYDA